MLRTTLAARSTLLSQYFCHGGCVLTGASTSICGTLNPFFVLDSRLVYFYLEVCLFAYRHAPAAKGYHFSL